MKKSSLQTIVTIIFAAVMIVSLFGALQYVQVSSTDEAAHGINAYEMSMDHHYIVNTLKHRVDYYNSKPPLMLWLIMLGYRFFGYTPLGMRVPSAAAGLILYLLVLLFCRKKWGTAEMLLFSAFLPACRILFDFHMFRSGDMDSVYTLFFALAVYSVYKAGEKPVAGMAFFGLFCGLAFMTKGPHAAFIAAIGILFYLLNRKKVGFRYLCMSAGVAAAVVLPWAVARFCHDGLALFSALLVGETVGRVEASRFTLTYFKVLAKEPACVIYTLLALIGTAVYLVQWKKGHEETDRSVIENVKEILQEIPNDIWILVIWFAVVFGGYFMAKGNLDWYIYSAFIPLGLLGAKGGGYTLEQASLARADGNSGAKWLTAAAEVIFYGVLAVSMVICAFHIRTYPFDGNDGGLRNNVLYSDLKGLREENGTELVGRNVYIQDSRNAYKAGDAWELDAVFYAETVLDWHCMDGGVEAFLATDDKDALLIFDKLIWDDYINVLTGYVILGDRSYLTFSKHTYGEEP